MPVLDHEAGKMRVTRLRYDVLRAKCLAWRRPDGAPVESGASAILATGRSWHEMAR
jgi:hypothetical protein